jgi:hypothetical protein
LTAPSARSSTPWPPIAWDYLALLDEARREGRVTTTAADVLAMQAQAIIAWLAGSAGGSR